MNNTELMNKTAEHVRSLFAQNQNPALPYHNLSHTEGVVKAAVQLADHYQLAEEDYAAVYIAAWFHDTGYLFGAVTGHEEKGAELATVFLTEQQAPALLIEKTQSCILTTRLPQQPKTLIEEIMCDADLFHFGTEQFKTSNKLVRKEVEMRLGAEIPDGKWLQGNIDLLREHRFKTDYARTLLQKGKEENLQRLLDKQHKKEAKAPQPEAGEVSFPLSDEEKKKQKEKQKRSERGVETMFRTTSTNHLRLSEMADNKAHIMITVNSIIVSALVSILFRKLENEPHLIIPSILTMTTSLVSMIFAILVTRPNVTQGTFTKEDINKRRTNLLFFGNFYRMNLEDYEWGITEMMNDSEFLYGSMTRDIHSLGKVLGRKYKLLRIAYNVFMFGFVISSLSFVLAIVLFK
ncbi:Pycsar system effector family protein [Chitinophagaceae bacterium MMS25-I14]